MVDVVRFLKVFFPLNGKIRFLGGNKCFFFGFKYKFFNLEHSEGLKNLNLNRKQTKKVKITSKNILS